MAIQSWLSRFSARRAPSQADVPTAVSERLSELEVLNARLTAALEEKTRAQQALAHSEAHFRAAFESHAVGQAHYDPVTGVTIRANQAFANMLGYEPQELIGKTAAELTHPEDRGRGRYEELMGGEVDSYAREKRHLRKDGSVVWGRASASLVRSPETGEPVLLVSVVEDIDDRHRALVALEQAKRDLELMVEQRTAALAQRDLLLREVYHRVKNNLQVVDGLLLMQSRRLTDPEARVSLDSLRGRVFALGLVHQQLMGSQDLETFDIAPFLEELSRHLLDGGGGNGITLDVRAAPLRVGLDFAIPLGLLVTELVTNSLKHGFPHGRGAIEVALDEADAGQLVLCVSDNGRGYDPTARPAATSLGATIIDGLVRQLRGEMTVEAEVGTRTIVRLPAPVAR